MRSSDGAPAYPQVYQQQPAPVQSQAYSKV